MQGVHLRKYGVQTTIDFELYEVDGVDLRTDWTPAAADCEVMKDGGASTQCTNTATDEGSTYSIVLTATEMEAARIILKIVDAATKVFLDKVVVIETYGNASAMHAFDLGLSMSGVEGKIDTVDTVVDGIQTDLSNATDGLGALKTLIDAIQTVVDAVKAETVLIVEDTGTTLPSTLSTIAGYIDTEITAIKAVTDALPDAGALSSLATLANQTAILAKLLKYVQLLARSDAAIETDNATELTAINADGGSGAGNFSAQTDAQEALADAGGGDATAANQSIIIGYIDTEIAAIKTVVDGIQTDLSNGTDGLGALKTLIDAIDTVVDAIKAVTDNLPDSGALTTIEGKIDTVDTVVDRIQTDLSNATDGLGALKVLIDAIDTVVDAIKAVTDNLPDSGALTTIDGKIDAIDTIIDWLKAVAEGDTYVDKTSTPWQLVVHKKGDSGTEYVRKDLKDVDGNNIAATTTVIGRHEEPA